MVFGTAFRNIKARKYVMNCEKLKTEPASKTSGTVSAHETLENVRHKLSELFYELYRHNGYGRLEVDMKILKRGQKEIILKMGKEFRFVVDFINDSSVFENNKAEKGG
jgi:hypothetical protein